MPDLIDSVQEETGRIMLFNVCVLMHKIFCVFNVRSTERTFNYLLPVSAHKCNKIWQTMCLLVSVLVKR